MKLTCNISIESIIHVVRIDLLTPHVPSGTAERGQKVDWTDDMDGPCPAGPMASNRFQGALDRILISQTRTQDSELWPWESLS